MNFFRKISNRNSKGEESGSKSNAQDPPQSNNEPSRTNNFEELDDPQNRSMNKLEGQDEIIETRSPKFSAKSSSDVEYKSVNIRRERSESPTPQKIKSNGIRSEIKHGLEFKYPEESTEEVEVIRNSSESIDESRQFVTEEQIIETRESWDIVEQLPRVIDQDESTEVVGAKTSPEVMISKNLKESTRRNSEKRKNSKLKKSEKPIKFSGDKMGVTKISNESEDDDQYIPAIPSEIETTEKIVSNVTITNEVEDVPSSTRTEQEQLPLSINNISDEATSIISELNQNIITIKKGQCRKCHGGPSVGNMKSNMSQSVIFIDPTMAPILEEDEWSDDEIETEDLSEELSKTPSTSDDSEAVFVISLRRLTPFAPLTQLIENSKQDYIFRWNFINIQDSFAFKLENSNDHIFKYKKNYDFQISKGVYLYLSKCNLHLELYQTKDRKKEHLLAKAELNVNLCLESIGTMFESNLKITNEDLYKCNHSIKSEIFGLLVCRYSIEGKQINFDKEKPAIHPYKMVKPFGTGSYEALFQQREQSRKFSSVLQVHPMHHVDKEEIEAFQEGLHLVLLRNKVLRTKQAEIAKELKDRTTWMHNELKWELTLQENAILSGKDPEKVRWRQWKDDLTANVKYRPFSNKNFIDTADITITIVELQLNPFCRIMNDNSILKIYIEYTFLQYSGIGMETKSVLKPEDESPLIYNFSNNFVIKKNDQDAIILAEMVKNNEHMSFFVISEPNEFPGTCQSCVLLGSCRVKIFDLLQNHNDQITEYFPIMDTTNETNELGRLKVNISGIANMRSMALQILTPETFKIRR